MKRYPGLCLVIMTMAGRERDCVSCATNIVLSRTITHHGVMVRWYNISKVSWDCMCVGNLKLRGGDIENWGKCVCREDEGTGIILAEMFSCNSKIYTIIISDEKDWTFSQSEAFRCGEEVMCISGACSRPLVSELINFTMYGGYLDTLFTNQFLRHLDW